MERSRATREAECDFKRARKLFSCQGKKRAEEMAKERGVGGLKQNDYKLGIYALTADPKI